MMSNCPRRDREREREREREGERERKQTHLTPTFYTLMNQIPGPNK